MFFFFFFFFFCDDNTSCFFPFLYIIINIYFRTCTYNSWDFSYTKRVYLSFFILISYFGLYSEKGIVSSIVFNSDEIELQIRSKCMVYVQGCLNLNHVMPSAGFSDRCKNIL